MRMESGATSVRKRKRGMDTGEMPVGPNESCRREAGDVLILKHCKDFPAATTRQGSESFFVKAVASGFQHIAQFLYFHLAMMETQQKLMEATAAYVSDFFRQRISETYVYHDLEHTRQVVEAVELLGQACELSEPEMEVCKLAAWFHDLGYDQGQEEHEERSCAYAAAFLRKHGYDEGDLQKVQACIRATKLPQQPADLAEQVVCDADLSHLGNHTYWNRCGRIRQELLLTQQRIMSEPEWVTFELNFLDNHHYHTDIAKSLFGKRKQKHIKELKKYQLRLNPETAAQAEELGEEKKKKGKKKKKKKGGRLPNQDLELKELNLGRGVETMYRTTYRTHVNLSSIADNKANIMLSINAIIISIVVANLVPQFHANPRLILPTGILLVVCLTALVFAILATRPKVTEGKFTREDIEQKRANLLFFGNFYNMQIDDFHWGMMEMIKDSDFLYSSMTRDLYYLGVVLAKKYRYLRICYSVFMFGLILSVLTFALSYLL